ncbi:MAG: ATP-binding cassette domain-containing protein [Elusimicrobia bacterium]|nr:ATP-binding cassette domain-containing protein [Elusimicrobiota bacterium]
MHQVTRSCAGLDGKEHAALPEAGVPAAGIRLENVEYATPPPRSKTLFSGLSLSVGSGENTVVYGDNGSGKTTLARLIMGLIEPRSGKVHAERDRITGMFEDADSQLFFSTVREEIEFASGGPYGGTMEILRLMELEDLLGRSTLELSFSQKARLIFALAYLTGREYMILDGPQEDRVIYDIIKKTAVSKERTIILLMPAAGRFNPVGCWKKYAIRDNRLEEQ